MGARRSTPPPDRLAAVLGEVRRARTEHLAQTDLPRPAHPSADRPGARARDTAGGLGADPTAAVPPAAPARRPGARPGPGLSTVDELWPHQPLARPGRSLAEVALAPSRIAVLALLTLALTAGLVIGGRLLWLRASSRPEPVTPPAAGRALQGTPDAAQQTRPAAAAQAAPAAAAPTGAPAAPTAAGPVLVHVVGQVRRPGVVQLTTGARLRDAVQAAGGALPTADLTGVNLARPVTDGEQVLVPRPGQTPTPAPGAPAGGPVTGPAAGGAAAAPGAPAGSVNLNTVDQAGLDALPGIGPVLAQRILQWRTEHGRFTSVDELGEVSGIGDKLMEQLRPLVAV